jgi:hypothetical protein
LYCVFLEAGRTGVCSGTVANEPTEDSNIAARINPFVGFTGTNDTTCPTEYRPRCTGSKIGIGVPSSHAVRYSYVASAGSKSTGINNDDYDDSIPDMRVQSSNSTMPGKFYPHYMTWVWENEDRKKYVSIQISVPSGLLINGKLEGKILPKVNNGKELTLHVEWPSSMYSTDIVVEGFSEFVEEGRSMHSMIDAFEKEIDYIREKMGLSEYQGIGSSCTIELPVECEGDIEMIRPVNDENDAVLLMILLKARVSSTKKSTGFVMNARAVGKAKGCKKDSTHVESYLNKLHNTTTSTTTGYTKKDWYYKYTPSDDDSEVVSTEKPSTKKAKYWK